MGRQIGGARPSGAEALTKTYVCVFPRERFALPARGSVAEGAARLVTLPLPRQQIADILGLTIETVSRPFTRMKTEGLIEVVGRREIAILQPEALKDRAG